MLFAMCVAPAAGLDQSGPIFDYDAEVKQARVFSDSRGFRTLLVEPIYARNEFPPNQTLRFSGRYTLRESGRPVWSMEYPWTALHGHLRDDGSFIASAYETTFDGEPLHFPPAPDSPPTSTILAKLDANGNLAWMTTEVRELWGNVLGRNYVPALMAMSVDEAASEVRVYVIAATHDDKPHKRNPFRQVRAYDLNDGQHLRSADTPFGEPWRRAHVWYAAAAPGGDIVARLIFDSATDDAQQGIPHGVPLLELSLVDREGKSLCSTVLADVYAPPSREESAPSWAPSTTFIGRPRLHQLFPRVVGEYVHVPRMNGGVDVVRIIATETTVDLVKQ